MKVKWRKLTCFSIPPVETSHNLGDYFKDHKTKMSHVSIYLGNTDSGEDNAYRTRNSRSTNISNKEVHNASHRTEKAGGSN